MMLRLPDGRVVMQRRDGKAPTSPNMLGFFGGHMEADETPSIAVKRELKEETSLPVGDLQFEHEITAEVPSPDSPSVIGTRVHLFSTHISSADFAVYEGSGAETHELASLLERNDVAPTARYLLENIT